ncbi:MAG: hypothetical protein ACJA13_000908 [Paraglaciecola sp.]|jgi:hypothetical protein
MFKEHIRQAKGFSKKVIKKVRNKPATTKNLMFLHMPKTGGTSLRNALSVSLGGRPQTIDIGQLRKSLYSISSFETEDHNYYSASGTYQEFLLTYYLNHNLSFISGHFTTSKMTLDMFQGRYWFVTCLRDPLERFISQYLYDKFLELKSNGRASLDITDSAREKELQNYLKSWRGWFVSHIYIWMLGGHKYTDELNSISAKTIAKENIARFDLVGFTDALPEFTDQLGKLINCKLKIKLDNSTKKQSENNEIDLDPYRDLFTVEVREQITNLCKDDYEIYHYAKQM